MKSTYSAVSPRRAVPVLALTAVLLSFGIQPAVASSAPGLSDEAEFTLDVVSSEVALGTFSATPTHAAGVHAQIAPISASGLWAVSDTSLIASGSESVVWSAKPDFVDVAWELDTPREIVVDGVHLGSASGTSVRLTGLTQGESHSVQVTASSGGGVPATGLSVYVPVNGETPNSFSAEDAQNLSEDIAAITERFDSTSIIWNTYIPEARVDAPPAGCDYGAGYEFNGDNRGWLTDPYGQYSSKIHTTTTIPRDGPSVWSQTPSIGQTHVYRESTGELVETRHLQPSEISFTAKKLDGDLGSASTYVDIRMALQAGNPFCTGIIGNSIEGAFTIRVTRSGSYQIISGSHRQMPNHQIMLRAFEWSGAPENPTITVDRYTSIYQRSAASTLCLVNMACPNADMTGWTGEY